MCSATFHCRPFPDPLQSSKKHAICHIRFHAQSLQPFAAKAGIKKHFDASLVPIGPDLESKPLLVGARKHPQGKGERCFGTRERVMEWRFCHSSRLNLLAFF
jgi:hypothetical protein